ncbi:MAG: hypothetical protein K2M48_07095, partial [Clostridiales bacterium]|nr:hypothetical protein [Clostridiales bacterium]
MDDCIFCKIIKGELPSKKYYEDELMIVIADIAPKACGKRLSKQNKIDEEGYEYHYRRHELEGTNLFVV